MENEKPELPLMSKREALTMAFVLSVLAKPDHVKDRADAVCDQLMREMSQSKVDCAYEIAEFCMAYYL